MSSPPPLGTDDATDAGSAAALNVQMHGAGGVVGIIGKCHGVVGGMTAGANGSACGGHGFSADVARELDWVTGGAAGKRDTANGDDDNDELNDEALDARTAALVEVTNATLLGTRSWEGTKA
jgi:hypothetical protein